MPIGTIIQSIRTEVWFTQGNNCWIKCDGTAIDQAMFPELYAMVGSKVPDLRNKMMIGSSDTSVTKQMIGTNALSFTLNNT